MEKTRNCLSRPRDREMPDERGGGSAIVSADDRSKLTINALFDLIAQRIPERCAVVASGVRLTYAEVRDRSTALAEQISFIYPRGTPVGILLDDAWFPIAALACLRMGSPIVPIDTQLPSERRREILDECRVSLILVHGHEVDLPAHIARIDIGEPAAILGGVGLLPLTRDEPAFILHTSGSTGRPKGICNAQAAILHRVEDYIGRCDFGPSDRIGLLNWSGTIAGLREVFTALLSGASLVVAPPIRLGLGGTLSAMADHGVTACYAVPPLLRAMLRTDECRAAFQAIRVLRVGGDIFWESDLRRARQVLPHGTRILASYSSTEIPTVFQWFVPEDWVGNGGRVPIGWPQPHAGLVLIDENGVPARRGELGELVVDAPGLALGTWQEGRLALREPGPIHSGDLVRLSDDGLATIMGRVGRRVKIRGQFVDPVDVEAALRALPCVADAAVVTRVEDAEATALDAFVVLREAGPTSPAIKAQLAEILPALLVPKRIVFLDAIPLLPGFKPDIAALKAIPVIDRLEAPDISCASIPIPNAIQSAVLKAWTETLDRASYEAGLRWDDAGGDSLAALTLLLSIERQLKVKMPPDILDAAATPASLARAICEALVTPAILDGKKGRLPHLIVFPGLGGDDAALAALRRGLTAHARLTCITYPDGRAMMRCRRPFPTIVEAAVDQIRDSLPENTSAVHLLGYSFGGFVAWEAAEILEQGGIRVASLGLIDPIKNVGGPLSRPSLGDGVPLMAWWLASLACHNLPKPCLLPICWLANTLPAVPRTGLQNFLEKRLRSRALHENHLSTLVRAATLYLSDASANRGMAEWEAHCPIIVTERIGGDHFSILEPPHRQNLQAFIARSLLADEGAEASLRYYDRV